LFWNNIDEDPEKVYCQIFVYYPLYLYLFKQIQDLEIDSNAESEDSGLDEVHLPSLKMYLIIEVLTLLLARRTTLLLARRTTQSWGWRQLTS
jgi:hypothetical protein